MSAPDNALLPAKLPADWTISTVGAQFHVILGKMLDSEKNIGTPKPYLGNRSVQWGRVDLSDLDQIKLTEGDIRKYRLQTGDLLVCEGGDIGRAAIWQDQLDECYFQKALHRLRPRGSYSPVLMRYLLEYYARTGFLTNFATQTSIAHLPKDKFVTVPLPLPSLPEQQAIAAALSDADGVVAGLERVIAKKRLIKQGAMQDLLTARRRLPGFSGEWEEVSVGEVVLKSFCGPSPTCEERMVSGHEWGVLKTTAITVEAGWDWSKHKVLPRMFWGNQNALVESGDVIVTKAGPRHRVGVVASVDFVPRNILVSGKMIGLRPNPQRVTSLMLSSAISSKQTQSYLDQRTTGMAESQVNFNNSDLLLAPIRLPPIQEQQAISRISSDIDAEIQALESRLAKARAVKEGMMQTLLTGRVRLV